MVVYQYSGLDSASVFQKMTYFVSFLFAYLFLVYVLRFQRLRSLHRRYSRYATRESLRTMTSHDAWAIQKEMLQLEFPTIALKSLQFALFRVCMPY